MRVIAGKAKGRQLKVHNSRTVRATSSIIKESIFSALASMGADLSLSLDLYAGSGALGVEALSRGGTHCDFVEQNSSACAIIRENLRVTGLENDGQVHCMKVRQALSALHGPYTLVLADPPYADKKALTLLDEFAASNSLTKETILVYEHSCRINSPEAIGNWARLNQRQHGDSAVSIYSLTEHLR